MVGSGQLPKFRDNLYHDAEDDVWLVPTAEVVLVNIHGDEILPASDLPIYYCAYTPCFRREKFSAGRDVRGIKRGHQFDKVEMVKIVDPATSDAELDAMVAQSGAAAGAAAAAVPGGAALHGRPGLGDDEDVRPGGLVAWALASGWRSRRAARPATSRPGGRTSACAVRQARGQSSRTRSTARVWRCPA